MGPELQPTGPIKIVESWPSHEELNSWLGHNFEKHLVIIDQRLLKLGGLRKKIIRGAVLWPVKAGESLKDLSYFLRQAKGIAKKLGPASGTNTLVISVGGGTVGDFAGFFASVFKRGVPWVQVPTTGLAAVDSAHGGKTGLNLSSVKNQFGTFHFPRLVIVMKDLLSGLPEKQIQSAFGEILKTALLDGAELFEELKSANGPSAEALWRILPLVVAAKMKIVAEDPFESKGHRQVLNLGHTLGHAIEALYQVPHGEAVAQGLEFALEWSNHRGALKDSDLANFLSLKASLGFLPAREFRRRKSLFRRAKWREVLFGDKKLIDQKHINFIFLEAPGRPRRQCVLIESLLTEAQRQGWFG